MNSNLIILTHFSQRYPKIPILDSKYENKVSIAFDMMTINLSNLKILPTFLPFLKNLFKEEIQENKDKTTAFQLKKQKSTINEI